MARMKAVQANKPWGEWELVERDLPPLDPGIVRIKVDACGICTAMPFDTIVQ